MSFQPFGYRFEVSTLLPPDEAKRVIRTSANGWFTSDDGPRGWIVGPFICLWLTMWWSQGPMLIGLISQDNFGTQIEGRAGSNLNGMAYLVLIAGGMVFAFVQMARLGDPRLGDLWPFGLLIIAILALMLWWASNDRHEADSLVEFLRESLKAVR